MNDSKKVTTESGDVQPLHVTGVSIGVVDEAAVRRCPFCKKEYVPTAENMKKHGKDICVRAY